METGAECRPCADDHPVSATTVAIMVLLVVVLICYFAGCFRRGRREGFVSPRAQEVYATTREVFGQKDATYSEFKTQVPGADAVLYTDMRSLWKSGGLSPEAVQKAL
jgi:hypothetical protein